MYSKLPPEDEQFIFSKHVEDIIGINLERKCIWLVLSTQIHYMYLQINISEEFKMRKKKTICCTLHTFHTVTRHHDGL